MMKKIFFQVFSQDFWNFLLQIVNLNLACNTSYCTTHPSRNKPATVEELINFYGVVIAMENSYGNNTKQIREHFKKIKAEHEEWKTLITKQFQRYA